MIMPNDREYSTFIQQTGLSISRATFYRLRKDLQTGRSSRLVNILDRAGNPGHTRITTGTSKRINSDKIPFLAFDGEGRTLEGKHKYVLLACSNGDSIYRPNGLSTVECLDFLLRNKKQRNIRIFFAFGYDVQQILIDLPDRLLLEIMHGEIVRYRNYTLRYMPGKIFSVNNVRFYDVFNFWQTSFIKAVRDSLGPESVSQELVRGKENRSNFSEWSIEDILRYTNEELNLLVRLAEHLRSILLRSDIKLGTSFYGPGSIANYWFKHHNVSPPPINNPDIRDIMERAYFGGRFESFKLGKVEPVYEYDINSAYPAVIAKLPYLDEFRRTESNAFDKSTTYSVWHVQWETNGRIGPFPSRDSHGLISYPRTGRGWYWKIEIESAKKLVGENGNIRILEGVVPGVIEGQPFAWVNEVYQRRLELKEQNDPAQQGLKLGLNSLYGKTAQRVGSAKYFSLAWAGYITSATRAKLLDAIVGREDDTIAFATDAVYLKSSNPRIPVGKNLGDFSSKVWNKGYFIQSGVYRLVQDDGPNSESPVVKDAYRGFSVKNGIEDLLGQIERNPFAHPSIFQTKFIGHLESIRCPNTLGRYRLSFITVRKKLQPFRTTKRRTSDGSVWNFIDDGEWIDGTVMHDTIILRGENFTKTRDGVTWNYYLPLLTRSIETEILENHNDHSDYIHIDIGELEESYPFARKTDRKDDIGFHDTDEIAAERLGGANGLINLSKVGQLPIVDEEEIIKELES